MLCLITAELGGVGRDRWRTGRTKESTYTCTSLTVTFALGVRGARISEQAMRAATAKVTVVKKPKTFWARTIVECIVLCLRGLFCREDWYCYSMRRYFAGWSRE